MKSLLVTEQNQIQVILVIFSAENNRIAVCDPVYPVYVDTNVMAGRTGEFIKIN